MADPAATGHAAGRARFSFGGLLLAALAVAPLASAVGTLLAMAAELLRVQGEYSAGTYVFAFILVAFLSFVLIVPALLFVGIPMALLMQRLGLPALARDAVFLAAGVIAAWLFARAYPAWRGAFELGLSIGLATAVLWLVAVRLACRRPAAPRAAP